MASANATFCDFLVRGVNLDAKDILTGKSDPYIVIKIPVRDPRTLAPPVIPIDNKRYSDPTSQKNNNNYSARDEIENELTNAVKDNAISTAGTYINAQGTLQNIKQVGQTTGSIVQDSATSVASASLPVSGVVAAAMLGSALYHYTRKTHPCTPGYIQIYESDVAGNTLNPHWQPFRLGLYELCRGNLNLEILIECYDWDRFKPSDYIGAIVVPVKVLLNATEEIKLQLLNQRRITSGLLFIQCQPSVPQIAHCDFHASAYGLAKKDLFGLSDPYFVIKVPQNIAEHPSLFKNAFAGHITIPSTTVACGIHNHKILKGYGEVFESFVVRKNLNPEWGTFRIGFYELCRGELDVNILIQCYDYNRILPSKFIGSAQVSIRSLLESSDAIALPLVSKKGKMAGTFYLQCNPASQRQTLPQTVQTQKIQQNTQPFVRHHPPLRYTRTIPTLQDNTIIASESPVLPHSSPAMESPYFYESPSYEFYYHGEEAYEIVEEAPESHDPQTYSKEEEAAETNDPQHYSNEEDTNDSYDSPYPSHPSCSFGSPPFPELDYEDPNSYSYGQSFPLSSNIIEQEEIEIPEIKVDLPPPVTMRKKTIARIPSYAPPVCPMSPVRSVSSPVISSAALPYNAPPRRKPPPPPKPSNPPPSTSSSSTIKPTVQVTKTSDPGKQVNAPPRRAPPRPPRSSVDPPSSSSISSSTSSENPSVPSSSSPPSKPPPPRPQRAKPPLGFSYLNPSSSIPSSSSSSAKPSSSSSSSSSNPSTISTQRPAMKIGTSCPQIERRPPNPRPAHYYVPSSSVVR